MRYLVLLMLLLQADAAYAEEPQYDYDAEIKRKKAELLRVAKQKKKEQAAIKKDRSDFEAYQARTKERQQNIRKQTRAIQDATGALRKKHATLGAIIGGHRRRVKGYALKQKNFGKQLIAQCEALIALARTLPPLTSTKAIQGLDYLRSELVGGSVDNVEAIHRITRMARKLDAQLMDIQVTQDSSSPMPQITGTVHRLRVGGVFEAVARGDSAAVWDFEQGKWVLLKDPQKARWITEAVEVRTGKKKPSLVTIPLAGRRKPEVQDVTKPEAQAAPKQLESKTEEKPARKKPARKGANKGAKR